MDDFLIKCAVIIASCLAFLTGIEIAQSAKPEGKDKCEKQNNVYECVMKWEPVK